MNNSIDFVNQVISGDALEVLKTFPDEFVDCVITSPPYWGLRDYGVEGQIGLEKTPEEYVEKLVLIFREVKRVLKKTGTLWLVLGDTYMSGGGSSRHWGNADPKYQNGRAIDFLEPQAFSHSKIKPKDLVGIPWRVAFALQQPYYTGKIKDEKDRVWLATMLDAEGNITLSQYEENDYSKTNIYISITSPNLEIINKCEHLFPQEIKHIYKKTKEGNGIIWQWDVEQTDNKMLFIREIYPYLVAKKKQAILAYTFLLLQKELLLKKKGDVLAQTEQRKILVEKMHQLNKGIDVELPSWVVEPPSLLEQGFYLRQDIIWCLSGGTYVYAKTQKGVAPTTIRDLARLNPNTIQLWNGEKWTKVLSMARHKRNGDEIELVLRSGERISCTPTHKFPTQRGLLEAKDIKIGDCLINKALPDTENPRDCALDEDAAWFAGLYIAEGSRSEDCIQISGHSKETKRWDRLQKIAKKYGGHITRTIDGNQMNIRLYGKVLNAIIDELVSGKIAEDKGFAPVVWQYSNAFIKSMLQGYLEGDGHWENENKRWRLGFIRNYNLERSLRTACARLGYKITLNQSKVKYKDGWCPIFRGEIRKDDTEHFNNKNRNEVVAIRKARCRNVYDIAVADEPHLFALASGILTHNSKPNPMPESVTDRCTKSHEYIFLLSKSPKYYFDNEAIKELATGYDGRKDTIMKGSKKYKDGKYLQNGNANSLSVKGRERWQFKNLQEDGQQPNSIHLKRLQGEEYVSPVRNKRDVWRVSTKPFKEAHFATFPPDLVEPMILAGCPEFVCKKCGKPRKRIIDTSSRINTRPGLNTGNGKSGKNNDPNKELHNSDLSKYRQQIVSKTLDWTDCGCNAGFTSGIVLDPFMGSGTTLLVAKQLNRKAIGIELNKEYCEIAKKRLKEYNILPNLFEMVEEGDTNE
jgi:DNA modification methylase